VRRVFAQSRTLDFEQLVVPHAVLTASWEHLRAAGTLDCEAALCWAGVQFGPNALVTTALLFNGTTEYGGVHVSPEQAGVLYQNCSERGLTLLAQMHSHPGSAFHSSIDERSPHSPVIGFVSIVVPNFAIQLPTDVSGWAVYEQTEYERWRKWKPTENEARISILDSVIEVAR
jgi:hypothetical protein